MALTAKTEKFGGANGQCFGAIGLMRFGFGTKTPEVHKLAIVLNGRNPSGMPFMPISALKAGATWSSVKSVFLGSRLSEVCPSIIQSISINMVQKYFRPLSGHPQPRQPMGHKRIPVNSDFDVIVFGNTSNLAFIPPSSPTGPELAKAWKPYKLSRVWVIMKNRAEILRSNTCLWGHPAQYDASWHRVKNAASGG